MRGRKKNQSNFIVSDSEEENSNSLDEQTSSNKGRSSQPKRGRPPKNKRLRLSSDESDNETSPNTALVETTMGTSPKENEGEVAETTNSDCGDLNKPSANNIDTNKTITLSAKRGRGRPPKKKTGREPSNSNIDNDPVQDTSANSIDTSKTITLSAKRGRGRPPKEKRGRNPSNLNGDNDPVEDLTSPQPGTSSTYTSQIIAQNGIDHDSDENSNCSSIVSDNSAPSTDLNQTTVPAKRGRGRPPKNKKPPDDSNKSDDKSDNNSNTQGPSTTIITVTAQRRRGRSSKNKQPSDDSDDNDDDKEDDDDSINNVDSNTITSVAKRGRGRPPKNKRLPDDSDDNEDDDMGSPHRTDSTVNNVFRRRSLRTPTTSRAVSFLNANRSPQPGTSRAGNSQPNTQNGDLSYEEESSGSESADSDDPFSDIREAERRNGSEKRKGRSKKKPLRKKQKVLNSTASKKSGRQSLDENIVKSPIKQNGLIRKSQKESFDSKLIENLAQKLVYFLFIDDQKKYAIKKKAIITHVFKEEVYSSKLFNAVITKANSILKKTYGMELMEVENQKDGYLVVNILSRDLGVDDYVELPRLKQQQNGLILYLLTVIFMNENTITEDELEKALKPLNMDMTSKIPHPIFGDVKKYITSELVKQMYLNYECVSKDPRRYEISWGVRAKEEVDKRDLLKFACQIMDDTTPESWILQYRDAEKSASPV